MRLTMSLRACAQCACAVALAITALFPVPALAEGAADAIAGKFADDEAKANPNADQDTKWIREEAKRAVERALAQENADPDSGDASAKRQPEANTDNKADSESNTETPPRTIAHETVEETSDEFEAERAADTTKMLDVDGEELADKLRKVRRKHQTVADEPGLAKDDTAPDQPGLVETAVSGIATKVAKYISPLIEKRVSILIVMEVGNKGVRAWSKTADPMVCIHEFCYLSRGPDKSAERLTRSAAFGPTIALGKRGQACRSKPACIFRDIDLETVEAKLQPVDLRFLRHDRREAKTIRADASCAIFDGALSCRAPVAGKGWRAWIVPETVAEKAGAEGLVAAMAKGLD